ncbi:MAG: UDP-N-acetylmuramoyl-L-alanyl-D-glutamate--2,6-diaminopimelate ligase [Gammaproteobacteria bacterium]|nr:UDP-N-acetylmuramoyl-L-alanyl-D-glutamate--2,6-diaminopimelate ligase [Gammaproteobacteria bacterium]
MSMSLRELLSDSDVPDVVVIGLCEDSRSVQQGDAFIAVRGDSTDGHRFVQEACGNGAVAVLCEHLVDMGARGNEQAPIAQPPQIVVADLKERRGALAAAFYGEPSRTMHCVGVTGTNGKTTIAHLVADMAGQLSHSAGYMGTIGWGAPGALQAARLTTESALTVHKRLAQLLAKGHEWLAMEVSSHALTQGRVAEVAFDVAVFSNLTRDHLDYHPSVDAYGAAKASLFAFPSLSAAVINLDDPFGQHLAGTLAPGVEMVGYGREADVSWQNLEYTGEGIRGSWNTPWGKAELRLPVAGEFSVANMAAAVAALCVSGLDFDAVTEAAANVAPVPGRMEFFRAPGRPPMVVDFAHTPDALDKVLEALRHHASGRLICVFGCGGDRDAGKRPLMARAAERHADVLWLTSDNPRSEEPAQILDDIAAGLSGGACVHRCEDRAEAIGAALDAARADDLVVVAGKGHEDYQEIAGVRTAYSDRDTVAKLLGVNC